MQRIERKLSCAAIHRTPGGGRQRATEERTVTVYVPTRRADRQDAIPEKKTAAYWTTYWNAVIDRIVTTLSTPDRPDLPTVPMSGGWGILHLEARSRLGQEYLLDISPPRRAYAMLRILDGHAIDRMGVDTGPQKTVEAKGTKRLRDNFHVKEFRLAAAVWFEQFPIRLDESDATDIALDVAIDERWSLMLAALLSLAASATGAGHEPDPEALYQNAASRFLPKAKSLDREELAGVALSSALGRKVAARDPRAVDDQWINAGKALQNPGTSAAMLARLMLRVLCERLFITLDRDSMAQTHLLRQLLKWLQGSTTFWLVDCLKHLVQFGGEQPLDPGAGFPAMFRPYDGTAVAVLESIEHSVPQIQAGYVTAAYLAAVLAVDRLLDPLRARRLQPRFAASGRPPLAKNDGFDRFAYNNLRNRMETTRILLSRTGNLTEFAGMPARRQLFRLVTELAQKDERTIRLAAEALQEIPAGDAPQPQPEGNHRANA